MTSRATRRDGRASGHDPRRARLAGLLRRAWLAYFAMRSRMRAGEIDAEGRADVLCGRARTLYRAITAGVWDYTLIR